MRALLRNPAGWIAFMLALLLVGTEVFVYFEHHRQATLREVGIATILTLIYFGVMEGLNAKRFIIRGHETSLYSYLTMAGILGIGRVVRKLDDPSTSWQEQTARFLLWMIVLGLIGASIDAVADHRRRAKE